jgi:hypothetical protein
VLEQELGAVYREQVIEGVDRGAQTRLGRALALDPGKREQAEARLAELRQIPSERCFIAAQHRRFLEAALASDFRERNFTHGATIG